MFGREDELVRYILALGLGAAVLSGLLTWLVARRYGRRLALVIPVLALVAVAVQMWRATGMSGQEGMALAAAAIGLAGPAVAGGLLGLMLSGRPNG